MKINSLSGGRPAWKAAIEWKEATKKQREEANLRTIRENEIVLDCDQHGSGKANFSATVARLDGDGLKFVGYKHREDDSGHVHLTFDGLQDYSPTERNHLRELFIQHYGCDPAKSSESTFIAREGKPHFKCGAVKKLVADFRGVNKLPPWLIEEFAKAPKKEAISVKDMAGGVEEGGRNEAAFRLATFHRKAGATLEEALQLLRGWNDKNTPPMPERELEAVVQSAYRTERPYGVYFQENPREAPREMRRIKVMSETELSSFQYPPTKWLMAGYIPSKSICVVGGKRSSMKTWFALRSGAAVASGKCIAPGLDTCKGIVLYCDEEAGPLQLKERLRGIKLGLGLEGGIDGLFLTSMTGMKFDQQAWFEAFDSLLGKIKPDLVILDTFRRFFSAEENDATAMNALFTERLRPLTEKHGVTWMLLHHMKKGEGHKASDIMEQLRGSSEMTNYADVVLSLQRVGNETKFNLWHLKNRLGPEQPVIRISAEWGENGEILFKNEGTAEDILNQDELCNKRIVEWYIQENKTTFSTAEVKGAMQQHGFSRPTIERGLGLVIGAGRVGRVGKGSYVVFGASPVPSRCPEGAVEENGVPSNPQSPPEGTEGTGKTKNKTIASASLNPLKLLYKEGMREQGKKDGSLKPSSTIYVEGTEGTGLKDQVLACIKSHPGASTKQIWQLLGSTRTSENTQDMTGAEILLDKLKTDGRIFEETPGKWRLP